MDQQFIDLKKKVIVVTGASSGIGRQIAVTCSQLGATIILIGRREEELDKTKQMLSEGEHLAYALDITDYSLIEPVITDAVLKTKPISGLCYSAGTEFTLPIKSTKPDDYKSIFAVNTFAAFELSRIVTKKKFVSEEGASLVFIASTMGVIARPGLTGYASSKGALISGVRAIALELANKKIRANCISPGTVMTDMIKNMLDKLDEEQRINRLKDIPLGIGMPEDVANLAAFLLSERSRWITGANYIIDGGYTVR